MNVLLLSTYELGRQPFGLASPAAWLRREGAAVTCLDLAKQRLKKEMVEDAGLVAFYVPMHTATRLAVQVLEKVQQINPAAHLCFYGLYAPVNEAYLRKLGVHTILGGEFETGLVSLFQRVRSNGSSDGKGNGFRQQPEPVISLDRQRFLVPDRSGLPPLAQYAKLYAGNGRARTVGYTEASRGCKHLCRHCPVVPVYNGRFRVVQREVVLEDIRRQVGAGAEHITFGDPDFFNGVGHAVALVEELHREFPALTYDVTIKIEHLLKHSEHLPALRDTGCLFVTSAVESVNDEILTLLDKGHTRADFAEVVRRCRALGLALAPTFVTFTPWTTMEDYLDLLAIIARLDLIESVAPIQLAIRLLIPRGSRLLELPEVRALVEEFDEAALSYRWQHSDPRMDRLRHEVQALVKQGEGQEETRRRIFTRIWTCAHEAAGRLAPAVPVPDEEYSLPRAAVPYLNEPWYC